MVWEASEHRMWCLGLSSQRLIKSCIELFLERLEMHQQLSLQARVEHFSIRHYQLHASMAF